MIEKSDFGLKGATPTITGASPDTPVVDFVGSGFWESVTNEQANCRPYDMKSSEDVEKGS